jgi:hypothetical protein
MNNLEGKDGLARDVAKLKHLYRPWKLKMNPHLHRFYRKPLPHEFTNLCTESSRADAYINGHIMAVSYGVLMSIVIGLSIALLA